MNFEQLRYLITTIEKKSVSNAAKDLFISQSALSQSIINLEKELDVPLLLRTNSGVFPTYYGNQIYLSAKPLIDSYDTLYKILHKADEKEEEPYSVHLIAIPSVTDVIADLVIPDVSAKYYSSNFLLIENLPVDNEINLMKEKSASICIGGCNIEHFQNHQALAAQNGYCLDLLDPESPTVLLISSKNRMAKKDTITDEDLSELTLAYYASEAEPECYKYFNQKKSYRLSDRKMVMKFINNNQAVGIYPAYIRRSESMIKNRAVKALEIISDDYQAFPHVCNYVIHKPDAEMSEAEKLLVNALRYYLSPSFNA